MGLNLRRLLPDSFAERKYVQAGSEFGEAVSYLHFGESIGFEMLLQRWEDWEREYARRGYRTISLDRFIEFGGYNKPVDDVKGIKRKRDEPQKLHAEIYRREFLGKIKPVINLWEITEGEPIMVNYVPPSTEA